MWRYCVTVILVLFLARDAMSQAIEKEVGAFKSADRALLSGHKSTRERAVLTTKAFSDAGLEQIGMKLENLSVQDLSQLFEAQSTRFSYSNDRVHLQALAASFTALVNQNKVERKHVRTMHKQYIKGRRFESADQLKKQFQEFDLEELPRTELNTDIPEGAKALWMTSDDERRLSRVAMVYSPDWEIIIISHPLCHFSRNALEHIKQDKELIEAIKNKTRLIAPQDASLNFDVLQKWNTSNPLLRIHLVDQLSAYEAFDDWDTPTFYFMRAGKLMHKFSGWPKEGNRAQLDEGLRKVGAISSEAIQKK
jgi:hypothetical protein